MIICILHLLLTDIFNQGTGPESVAENQHIVDKVSRTLHFISHAQHAMSDIIVDMGQAPPRNLSCRPIIVQQSAILQAGIPIQLEVSFNNKLERKKEFGIDVREPRKLYKKLKL